MRLSESFLIERARQVREKAYAPYSEYKVGAAIETDEGTFMGANIEVSGRNTSIHAESMALFLAVMSGAEEFNRLAISHRGDSGPCGLCLHTLSEFTDDLEILIDTDEGYESFNLADEFENAYRPSGAVHHDHHDSNDESLISEPSTDGSEQH